MRALAGLCLSLCLAGAAAQEAQRPADAIDAFHAAMRSKDSAGALSMLERSLVVFESGSVDASAEAYGAHHLPKDMAFAAATSRKLLTRRTGSDGGLHWVLSTYRVTGEDSDGRPIDQTLLETAILRRAAASFRIVHLHWSTKERRSTARPQRAR